MDICEFPFKTMKSRPDFPERFGCVEDSRSFCQNSLRWYNTGHYHSSIGYLTPEDVHYERAEQILKEHEKVLEMVFEKHPIRFKGKVPKPMALPKAVWINKPSPNESNSVIH